MFLNEQAKIIKVCLKSFLLIHHICQIAHLLNTIYSNISEILLMNKIKATYTVIWWEGSGVLGKSNDDFDWKMAEESHRLTTLKK